MAAPAFPPFQALLDEHGPVVWRLCRASLGPADGDDCFQDTMLAAMRAYPSLRHAGNLRGWLLTIAHNQVVDQQRRRSRRREDPLDLVRAGHEPSIGGADEDAHLDGPGGIWERVGELPEKQRAAIVHRYVADLPYAAIGALLDCSEAAARQSVRAGLGALRRSPQFDVAAATRKPHQRASRPRRETP